MTRHGPFREYAVVVLLLVVGVSLRLTGVDWDQGQHLHPDERFLTMVATSISAPDSIGHYFDTGTSPSNPANVGYPFFVYGTLPLFLTKLVASVLGIDSYAHVHIVGRMLSALFDCGTILLTWLVGRLLGGARVGLAAAALMAVSVPSIQHAHFFTVDSLAAFFALAALYGLLRIARGGQVSDHLLFGVSFGLALACRINLVLLAPFYALVAARSIWHGRRRARETLYRVALTAGVTALLFRIAQPYAFAGPGFFDVTPAPDFLVSLSQLRDMVAGKVHFPPAMQWIGRLPVLFAGRNLFLWNMGPVWGLAALGGWSGSSGAVAPSMRPNGRAGLWVGSCGCGRRRCSCFIRRSLPPRSVTSCRSCRTSLSSPSGPSRARAPAAGHAWLWPSFSGRRASGRSLSLRSIDKSTRESRHRGGSTNAFPRARPSWPSTGTMRSRCRSMTRAQRVK